MRIRPFTLERYFAKYEFNVRYLLSPSDCEALSLSEVMSLADAEGRALWQGLTLGYTESPGHPRLRAEIAAMYERVAPEQVVVAVPEEAIFVAMNTLLSPEDHVVTISPAYQSLYEIANTIGCEVTPWPVEARDGRWSIDVDALAGLLRPNTRLIVINFPHNPTGFLASRAELDAIVALARERGAYLFSDEMYRWLEQDDGQRLPAVVDIYEKGISLCGLSKSFALAGLRVGWLVAPDTALAEAFITFKDYTTICNSAPSEILAVIALRARESILARNLGIVAQNRTIAESFFGSRSDLFEWLPPDAGSTAFVRWLGPGTVDELAAALLDAQGLMILPDSVFDVSGNYFRVGLGRFNFWEALEALGDYVDGLPDG
ncbi:MAG: aminotransferase class I/II-fold pyridoxal phosphate-dependent enzyme [Anaerolineae bacterium]